MATPLTHGFVRNFLGHSPGWYKLAIVGFLILNPLVLAFSGYDGPLIVSWLILIQFIFTLAMALKCYPLQPGGLLAIEAVLLQLVSPATVYHEVANALPMLLLLIFMLAGIYFLKDLLLLAFSRLVLSVHSQSLLLCLVFLFAALLAAFLNAITVVAVAVTVAGSFYQVFHRAASGKPADHVHDAAQDAEVQELHRSDLDAFRAFLRSFVMTAAIGAAVGGAFTAVGQPQNLLIARHVGWSFVEFFDAMTPTVLPLLGAALITCIVLSRARWLGYGEPLPLAVRTVLAQVHSAERAKHNARDLSALIVQAIAVVLLVTAIVTQAAEVGLVGLLTIIVVSSFTGITEEQRLGRAFTDPMPFTALVVVFLVIVAVLREQHAFEPVIAWVLDFAGAQQSALFYLANGALSAISDNVFVATLFATELKAAWLVGTIQREQFEALAVATVAGSNIISVFTPNGQAALLLLLTSTLAPVIRLSYGRMVLMALPYAVLLSVLGLLLLAAG